MLWHLERTVFPDNFPPGYKVNVNVRYACFCLVMIVNILMTTNTLVNETWSTLTVPLYKYIEFPLTPQSQAIKLSENCKHLIFLQQCYRFTENTFNRICFKSSDPMLIILSTLVNVRIFSRMYGM
jgi:hypothetical protein